MELKQLTADDYREQFLKLLPQGKAWDKQEHSSLWWFADGIAQEFYRIQTRAVQAMVESLADSADELFNEWEQTAGLPDSCFNHESQSMQSRRQKLVFKLQQLGGQSKSYFIDLLEYLGYSNAQIEEPQAMTCNDTCNDAVYDEDAQFTWIVHLQNAENRTQFLTCDGDCNGFLQSFGNDNLLCILSRLKPAHTQVFIAYH